MSFTSVRANLLGIDTLNFYYTYGSQKYKTEHEGLMYEETVYKIRKELLKLIKYAIKNLSGSYLDQNVTYFDFCLKAATSSKDQRY